MSGAIDTVIKLARDVAEIRAHQKARLWIDGVIVALLLVVIAGVFFR